MDTFPPYRLKQLRTLRAMSASDLAEKLQVSVAQIHRLENGQRRLTVDTLLAYCSVLDFEVSQLFSGTSDVPITGIVNTEYQVLPTPPDSVHQIALPAIVPDIARVAGLRWEPGGAISRMFGHVLLYYTHDGGVGEEASGNRCLIVREDGTQCLGWPVIENGVTHIDNPDGRVEFNVNIRWASPILAVIPPFVVDLLQTPI